MESSPLPSDQSDGNGKQQKKKRLFDEKTKTMCWNKADVVQGRHPERWRKDSAGNTLCRKFLNCQGCLCYEYDHIRPFSKGGQTDADNCQILQSRVNRSKGNNDGLDNNDLERFSCDLKFTDHVEMGEYLLTVDLVFLGYLYLVTSLLFFFTDHLGSYTDKELDIIEMAVYGNVIRPGHQCHCKTVAEMLGQHKLKGPQIACELPYKEKH